MRIWSDGTYHELPIERVDSVTFHESGSKKADEINGSVTAFIIYMGMSLPAYARVAANNDGTYSVEAIQNPRK